MAPQRADAPIQSFVAIEPFAVRHEALLRLRDLPALVGVTGDSLPVAAQATVIERLADLVLTHHPLAKG